MAHFFPAVFPFFFLVSLYSVHFLLKKDILCACQRADIDMQSPLNHTLQKKFKELSICRHPRARFIKSSTAAAIPCHLDGFIRLHFRPPCFAAFITLRHVERHDENEHPVVVNSASKKKHPSTSSGSCMIRISGDNDGLSETLQTGVAVDAAEVIRAIRQHIASDDRFTWSSFFHIRYVVRSSRQNRFSKEGTEVSRLLETESIPQYLWPAAVPYATWLLQSDAAACMLRHRRVLELGCGVGLCGLAAARHASLVVLTDISPIAVAMVSETLEAPDNSGLASSSVIRCARLAWGDVEGARSLKLAVAALPAHDSAAEQPLPSQINNGAFDVVIGSDIFYFNSSLTKGLATVKEVLRPGGVFCCASVVRSDRMEDDLDRVPLLEGFRDCTADILMAKSAAQGVSPVGDTDAAFSSAPGLRVFCWQLQ